MKGVIKWCLLFVWLMEASPLCGHPGWGIVVDRQGDILFTDVSRTTIWRYTSGGELQPLVRDSWTHSLQLDESDQIFFGREEYREGRGPYNSFWKLTAEGRREQLIAPILTREWHFGTQGIVDGSGNIYFPGVKGILRRNPMGQTEVVVPNVRSAMMTIRRGPLESIYFTDGGRINKVSLADGKLTVVARGLRTSPPDDPYFADGSFNDVLGFDVADDGTIFIAYMGNRRLLQVDQAGKRREVYHAPAPWAPVGVACHGNALYVLETSFVQGSGLRGPRVRRRLEGGQFETLVSLEDLD